MPLYAISVVETQNVEYHVEAPDPEAAKRAWIVEHPDMTEVNRSTTECEITSIDLVEED